MANDQQPIPVDDMELAALVCYLYEYESLCSVTFSETGHAIWHVMAPSEDVKILEAQMKNDEITVQLLSFCKIRSKLNRILRIAKQEGSWDASLVRDERWWQRSRDAAKVKQAARK
jgi:hypothetical protein